MDSQTQNKRLVGLRTLAGDQAKSSISQTDEKEAPKMKEPALMKKSKEFKVITPKKPQPKIPTPPKEPDPVVVISESKNKLSDFNKKAKEKDTLPPPPKSTVDIRIENAEAEAATIITDTKKDRFKLFPAISASIKGWFSDKKAEKAAKKAPKYTVPETTRRQGVIQRATSVTAKSTTADHDNIQERIRRREEEDAKVAENKALPDTPSPITDTKNSLPQPPQSQGAPLDTKEDRASKNKLNLKEKTNLDTKSSQDTTWTPNTEPGFPLLGTKSKPKPITSNLPISRPPHNFVSNQKEIVINNIKEAKQGLINQQAFTKKSSFSVSQKPQISVKTSTDTKPNTVTTKEKVFAPTEKPIATFAISNPARTPKVSDENPINQSEDKSIRDKNSQSAVTWSSDTETTPLNIQLSKNIQSSQTLADTTTTSHKPASIAPSTVTLSTDTKTSTPSANPSSELKSAQTSDRPRAVINIVPKASAVSSQTISASAPLNKLAQSSSSSDSQSIPTSIKTTASSQQAPTTTPPENKTIPSITKTTPVAEINESLAQAVLPSHKRPTSQPLIKTANNSSLEETSFKNDFSKTNTNSLVFSVSLALVAIISLVITSYYYLSAPKNTPSTDTIVSIYPTILNLPLRPIYQPIDSSENFLSRIQSEFSQRPDKNYFLFVSSPDDEAKPIQPSALLPFLNIDKNSLFNRSLSFVYFGSLSTGNTFIVLQTTDPIETQGGLLKWETEMYDALSPILAYNNTASSTPTRFVDGRLSGNDIRVLKDQDGNEHLAYSFITQNTVIITNNHQTLGDLQTLIKR